MVSRVFLFVLGLFMLPSLTLPQNPPRKGKEIPSSQKGVSIQYFEVCGLPLYRKNFALLTVVTATNL